MADRRFIDTPTSSASHCWEITPDDDEPLEAVTKGIYIGTGGTVTLRAIDSAADVTFTNVPDGAILDVRATHVRATGTGASDIVGMA